MVISCRGKARLYMKDEGCAQYMAKNSLLLAEGFYCCVCVCAPPYVILVYPDPSYVLCIPWHLRLS
jgi:hypothetical protein